MASKQFNSVTGYSVGNANVIIDANGNISANSLTVSANANITANVNIGTTTSYRKLTIGDDANAAANIGIAFSTTTTERGSITVAGGTGILALTAGYAGYGGVMAVNTNGSERMRVDTNGNVGIGTTTPQQPLVISDNGAAGLEISPTAIASAPAFVSYNRSGAAWTQLGYSALQHVWQTSGAEKMQLDANGNLGIGNTAPTDKLSVNGNVSATYFIGNGSQLTGITASFPIANGNSNVNVPSANGNINFSVAGNANILVVTGTGITTGTGTGGNISGANVITANLFTGTLTTAAQPNLTSVGALTGLTVNGNATVNLAAGNTVTVAATAPPTTDLFTITNAGQNVATAGVSGLQVTYVGGTGAIEASAIRADMIPGSTSGSTWNAFRVAATAAAASGVAFNGVKFDNKTAGAGTSSALYIGTGYDNIINYNGTAVIYGNGVVNGAQVSTVSTAGTVTTNAQPNITSVGTLTSLGVSGNVTANNIVANTFVIVGVGTGISAAGTVQANATVLVESINVVSTVASGTGVKLPDTAGGMRITVLNTSANALLVYPPVNDIINSQAANAAYSQPAGARLDYISTSATQWYTLNATYG